MSLVLRCMKRWRLAPSRVGHWRERGGRATRLFLLLCSGGLVISSAFSGRVSGAAAPAPGRLRLTPPELVAEAVTLPPGSTLTGRPLSLLTAVAAAQDRRQQFEAVHAYWRLVETVAEYRFCLDYDRHLSQIREKAEDAADLRAARAASAAQLREAELEATTAQHELAAMMMLPIDAPLPLPADRPHVGAYRTHFAELFSMRSAPDRARLIDRTLPLRARAIDGHAAAVEAAEDALGAAMESQTSGTGRLAATVACLDEHLRQRRAMIASVCRYNHDIADYALTAVAPNMAAEVLVGMLIRQNRETAQPIVSRESSGVQPASYEEPVPALPALPAPPVKNWPTRAVRPVEPRAVDSAPQTPTAAQPAAEGTGGGVPAPAQHRELKPIPTTGDAPAGQTSAGDMRIQRTSNKPVVDDTTTGRLYPALGSLSPLERASQLTAALHRDRALPPDVGRPVSLAECLGMSVGMDRREVLGAYWLARQRAAQHQAIVEQAQWLEDLAPALLRQGPQSAGAMLRLRTSRLAIQTAQIEAQLDLIEAQFELAGKMGRAAEPVWLLPGTAPFAGQYAIVPGLESHGEPRSWPLRRLKATLPALGEHLRQRATAVVEADARRADATAAFQAGRQSFDRVLDSIRGQTEQTFAFLQGLTEYNRAIAEYAVATLPPDTPADKLAAALVQ